jgi:hypothetical protein
MSQNKKNKYFWELACTPLEIAGKTRYILVHKVTKKSDFVSSKAAAIELCGPL